MGNNNFYYSFQERHQNDSIAITQVNYMLKRKFFPKFFKIEKEELDNVIKSTEDLPNKLDYDARLVKKKKKKRYGHFYLCILKKLDEYNGPSQNKVIAFDPKTRTFWTGYNPDRIIVEVGKSDTISKVYRLCDHYGRLQSKWFQPEIRHRKKYRQKKSRRARMRR